MASIANRRSVMTLYSSATSPYSHRARIVLAEKNITYEIQDVEAGACPEDLAELNPYNTVPTLVDRDLVLFDSRIIMEYLDERFPHPPLMPVDPVSRANSKLYMYRIDRDMYSIIDQFEAGCESRTATKLRKELRDSLTVIAPIFDSKPFFMSDEFTLIDCYMAPLLWRLPKYGIELPAQARAVNTYAERLFSRESFQTSLTEAEREMRD
ncbi:glutathione S-transferase N-terminal domain-containing protein [Sulfuriflexus sp.]|uniref:glutathione S-transferase N-terminal domain-containing protein n=1 Tax=Sulfuriflexus sp. TaxID=2015443 RepID=UPI0028CC9D59|nr:glutathione S-transferase N-terminal domain-containing protein [Sulfuriflexus sp.]MDT8403516.1 glutathione S-transferase N-terminal domain-containing protein [Sulfuriflexus sp.]